MNPREIYGITDCTNPEHKFSVGRIIGAWQWANDYWSILASNDHEHALWFYIGRIKNMEGLVLHTLVIYKLQVTFGFKGQK